jgi:tRNA threonylcarbamoyladenosine biosynthesis protein TsaE
MTVVTRSERGTLGLARKLARSFKGKEVVFLEGELGAGKTVFAKGIASGLGMKDTRRVCSPTFTIMNIYRAKFPIFHFDLYRLERSSDILDLGWEDYLEKGIVLVEWAERIVFDYPAIRVVIQKARGNERRIKVIRRRGRAAGA